MCRAELIDQAHAPTAAAVLPVGSELTDTTVGTATWNMKPTPVTSSPSMTRATWYLCERIRADSTWNGGRKPDMRRFLQGMVTGSVLGALGVYLLSSDTGTAQRAGERVDDMARKVQRRSSEMMGR